MTKEFNRDSVKLHATVMNARFVESSEPAGARPTGRDRFFKKKKNVFNASNVLKVRVLI